MTEGRHLLTIRARTIERAREAAASLSVAIELSDAPVEFRPLFLD